MRGTNNSIKDYAIREMIKSMNVDIVGLTETKLCEVDKIRAAYLWGSSSSPIDFIASNASQSCSGGVLMIWNTNDFKFTFCTQGSRWIIAAGHLQSGNVT